MGNWKKKKALKSSADPDTSNTNGIENDEEAFKAFLASAKPKPPSTTESTLKDNGSSMTRKSALESDNDDDDNEHEALSDEDDRVETKGRSRKTGKKGFGSDSEDDEEGSESEIKVVTAQKNKKSTAVSRPKMTDPRFTAMNDKNWGKKFGMSGAEVVEGDDGNEDQAGAIFDDGEDDGPQENADGKSDDDEGDDDDDDQGDKLPADMDDILGLNDSHLHKSSIPSNSKSNSKTPEAPKPLTLSKLTKFNDKIDKSGVIYISRTPPFMKPTKLRQLLAVYGILGRIYMAPEDPKITARRKKYRGNKRQNYVEAWVEFEDKKVARETAAFLNLRPVDPKKGSRYHDDLWNMKYLPRFKWHHLTDQIAYERAVREQKMRAEMASVKRENKAYLRNVEKGKMIEAMEEKKRRKREIESGGDGDAEGSTMKKVKVGEASSSGISKVSRQFRQRAIKDGQSGGKNFNNSNSSGGSQQQSSDGPSKKASVLSKIFG
jgi:ESF2/ABP1 family protein